jgi:hypothetical protein
MLYTGDSTERCPISFLRVKDIENPVGFDGGQAYECDHLIEWLTRYRHTNPITSQRVEGRLIDILHPLIVEGNDAHVSETLVKLGRAGTIQVMLSG